MSGMSRLVNLVFKGILRAACRIDDDHWASFPRSGPLLVVANHINFLEVPLMVTHLLPRPVTGFAKSENWENPVLRRIFEMWGAIPLRRGEADLSAIRAGIEALEAGRILAVAPEGTRSGDGVLGPAHPGTVTLALRTGAPILPVAYWGHEVFWDNIRRLRRTPFQLEIGRPFALDPGAERVTRDVRQRMADEIMLQIARLLPAAYHGHYAGRINEPRHYVRPLPLLV